MENILKNIVDLKGRFIPGIILLINLFFLDANLSQGSIQMANFLEIARTFSFLSQIIIFIAALLLGGTNQFISFRIMEKFMYRPDPVSFFKKRNNQGERNILSFYKKESKVRKFTKSKATQLFGRLKERVVAESTDLAEHAKKLEGDVNLFIGMVIPLSISIFFLFSKDLYIYGTIAVLILVVDLLDFHRSITLREPHFVYINYYSISIIEKDKKKSENI